MAVKLIWATPDIDKIVGFLARVSNPEAEPWWAVSKLIKYLIGHRHWSPLEMANVCVEITTTRDIARQILRHRSFHFQEFSQRYAEVPEDKPIITEQARLQDPKNRQNSIPCQNSRTSDAWIFWQNRIWDFCWTGYQACLKLGIAKELARKLLPEGLTYTKMYMNGTVRDWYHYVNIRTGVETQLEHRQIAVEIEKLLKELAPAIFCEE